MNTPRMYYASAVLADGRLFVAGGEYAGGSNRVNTAAVEIYDPVADQWTTYPPPVTAPPNPTSWASIGDAPCCLLADGRVLLGNALSQLTAFFDPKTNLFSPGPAKGDNGSEETWTLLPDGTVLAVQCSNPPNAEKYVPSLNTWVSAGSTASINVTLPQACPGSTPEIGPAILLPDGRVFCLGATGQTALYVPPALNSPPRAPNTPGKWAAGPTFKDSNNNTLFPMDAPACLLPNGKVLCAVSPGPPCKNPSPVFFFEYDPATNGLASVTQPNGGVGFLFNAVYKTRMLLLPTGKVLYAGGPVDPAVGASASTQLYVYNPDGAPNAAWKPQITTFPSFVLQGQAQTLQGRQLNGLSQAVSYGDDAAQATNYPLLRIRNLATNHTKYARTANHSTMGVATGNAIESTQFTVPFEAEPGASEVTVTANGISSDGWTVPVMYSVRHGLEAAGKRLSGKGLGSLEPSPRVSLKTLMSQL